MSDKEKQIIRKLSVTITKLDKEKQNYVLGVAEGMAIARETERANTRELEEVKS